MRDIFIKEKTDEYSRVQKILEKYCPSDTLPFEDGTFSICSFINAADSDLKFEGHLVSCEVRDLVRFNEEKLTDYIHRVQVTTKTFQSVICCLAGFKKNDKNEIDVDFEIGLDCTNPKSKLDSVYLKILMPNVKLTDASGMTIRHF